MTNETFEIPEDVLTMADLPNGSASSRATRLLALELFREGRISPGRAVDLAGVRVEDFMEFSVQPGIASLHGV